MNFPVSRCPHCGQAGISVTSLGDKFFQYTCANIEETRTPKCGIWTGRQIPDSHRRAGEKQLEMYRRAYLWSDWADDE